MLTIQRIFPTAVILAACTAAAAQWSDDPQVNTLVSGGETGCVVTHAAGTPDGHVWVAWYDSGSGYDIRLQRLDHQGEALFDPPVLISDQELSWVQDFDLACDAAGRAVVAWAGSSYIGALLVNHAGDVVWSHEFAGGSGAFLGSAQVCGTSDGDVVVGWLQDEPSYFQRVTPSGGIAWLSERVIDAGGTTAVSDLQPTPDGGVVASFVHYLTFTGPKRLKAQRLSVLGTPLWGSEPVDVFTSGSLQFGAYPEFISDGSGGGVFSWYETSPLMARVQWVDGAGSPRWGSSGAAVTTESAMVHVAPAAALDDATGDVTVYWIRQNATQSTAGVQANRFDQDGTPQWGGAGTQVVAPSPGSVLDLQAGMLGDLATGMWISDASLGGSRVVGAALDPAGTMQWGAAPTVLGSGGGTRQDLSIARAITRASGQGIAVWSDNRDAASRVYAQNVNADGTLGGGPACLADLSGDGQVGTDDVLAIIGMWGPCGGCPEDLSGDGIVGADDLLEVLSQWGPC
ncbi:MAG: hypothetical protein QF733_00875 [Phycisphaerales bacterium]|jgi:hypothetical protein|nr:hypothetical protein [Phycisphaerales bacterium]